MTQPIITVEGLGKRYLIRHQAEGGRYRALRDVIAGAAKNTARALAGRKREFDSRTREEFWALRDVSFEVRPGEAMGIIGRNGAGKSTLLKVLSRITEPTTGRIHLRGRVASLLEVGTGFHPELTGRENIFLNGAILGMTRAEILRKFDEIVDFAEVERFLDTPVKRYSSGMYVRLAFAVAAHLEPEILVVDEVLAVGDVEFQKKCLGKMGRVSQEEGRTVLFVSHNMAAVQTLCTSGVYLKGGQVAEVGPLDSVIPRYLSDSRVARNEAEGLGIRLANGLKLDHVSLNPNPVRSGDDVDFALRFQSDEAIRLEAIVLSLYTIMGSKVGQLDLRRPEQYLLEAGVPFELRGTIRNLPLVPGEYRLGVYVANPDINTEVTEVEALTVDERPRGDEIVPYLPQYRGIVEFDCEWEQVRAADSAKSRGVA